MYLGRALGFALPLIALVLIVVLLRMGAFLGPMTHLVIVEAGLIALGSYGASLPSIPLG